jgi:hypothetical protein
MWGCVLLMVVQELTQALYQHDAACRVIARLVKERDEVSHSLLSQSVGQSGFQYYQIMHIPQWSPKLLVCHTGWSCLLIVLNGARLSYPCL